ncbi:MAG TPA: S49 family peptidase [Methylibium sp.]|nr:S49 family peptidase [Methylibium sp.]
MKYPHLAAQIFNVPLLVHPQKLDAIIAGLGERLVGTRVDRAAQASELELPAEMFSTRKGQRSEVGYTVTDGVAIIFASGALVHREQFNMADSTYFVGYNRLAEQLEAAVADPDVHAVLQIYDSPGGQVSGAFEYGDRIAALRGKKPMWAIADDLAASAAYLAGSAFEQFAVSATGYVGSVGVVMRHVDFSRALANDGIKVTHIFAGAHKVDGNPYEPLPKDVQASLQADVEGLYETFVQVVARHRGMDADAVRATQARTYRGQAGVEVGLADRVATTDQLISELAAMRPRAHPVGQSARSTASTKGAPMSGNAQGGQPAAHTTNAAPAAAITRESLERDHPALFAQVRVEFTAAGAQAERDRIAAVRAQALPGHEKLIEQLATDGKTTGPEAAQAVLAAERSARTAHAASFASDAPQPAPASAAPGVDANAAAKDTSLPIEQRAKAEWDAKPEVRGEFTSFESYLALRKAEESGRVRVLGKKSA